MESEGIKINNSRKGFTLIELLVALVIMTTVGGAVGMTFQRGLSIWKRLANSSETNNQARVIFQLIGEELRNAVSVPGQPISGSADLISFYTVKGTSMESRRNGPEIVKVTYRLAQNENAGGESKSWVLVHDESAYGSRKNPSVRQTHPLSTFPTEVRFEYAYPGQSEDSPPQWMDQVDEEREHLIGVRLLLSIGDAEKLSLKKTMRTFL